MSKNRARGASLLSVMFVTIVLFTTFMIAAGSWSFQLGLSSRDSAHQGARRLAESAAQLAMARLLKKADLSVTDLPSLQTQLSAYPEGLGLLAFDETEANRLKIPKSVNNLTGTTTAKGWDGSVVQIATANLLAVGHYHGIEERIEIVLNVPQFPYVVGSSVPIKAIDGLEVFGLKDKSALAGGFAQIPPDMRVPGHILTNGGDSQAFGAALQLNGSSTKIEGDAKAVGSIQLQNGALVTGDLRPNSSSAALPKVDIAAFDVQKQEGHIDLQSGDLAKTKMSGFNRRDGNLSVTGGLDLDSGVLFVNGDLNVQGGLTGKGAIFSTGKVTISGGGALEGDSQAAIIANKDIKLLGSAQDNSEFRGLLYTEGNLECRHTNVAGSIVVNNSDPGGSTILEHVKLAESAQMGTKLNIQVKQVKNAPAPPNFNWAEPVEAITLGTPEIPMVYYPQFDWSVLGDEASGFHLPPSNVDPVSLFHGTLFFTTAAGGPVENIGTPATGYTPVARNGGQLLSQGFSDTPSLIAAIIAGQNQVGASITQEEAARQAQIWADHVRNVTFPQMVKALEDRARYNREKAQYDAALSGQPSEWYTEVPFSLDFSQFYKIEDRIRILSWRRR